MGKRYPTTIERADGWSDWQHMCPGFRMACCDCGLVHELQVRAHRPSRVKAKPGYICVGPKIKGARVMFRASRNMRATAQIRRARHKPKSKEQTES